VLKVFRNRLDPDTGAGSGGGGTTVTINVPVGSWQATGRLTDPPIGGDGAVLWENLDRVLLEDGSGVLLRN